MTFPAFGKVTSLVIASSKTGGVLLHRAYGDEERASELLQAMIESSRSDGVLGGEEAEGRTSECFTSCFEGHNIVFQRVSDVLVYCSGNREQNHARLAKVIESFLLLLVDAFKKSVTEERILKNYAKVCALVEDVLNEGIVQ